QVEAQKLPMVRVRTRERHLDGGGVATMNELLAKRGQLERLAEPEAVTELIAKSGGHGRDLLRLGGAVCGETIADGQERITAAMAKRATERFANDIYGKMAHEVLDALVEVYQKQHLPKQHGRLAQNLLVLEYRDADGRAWNDLHPCVLELSHVKEALKV